MNEFLDVKTVDYEGPLDLLVHLVYKNEMNIFDVSISEITGQFIAEIQKMHDMDIDMEVAADFINMASYLVYLKSRMLLPRDVLEDEEIDIEEAKSRFNQLLIEYSFYKDIAVKLRECEAESSRFLSRSESVIILNDEPESGDGYTLAPIFFQLMTKNKKKELVVKNSQVATEKVVEMIKSYILSRKKTLWSEIKELCSEKIEECISFGTALQLVKSKKTTAFQKENFGEILLTLIEDSK